MVQYITDIEINTSEDKLCIICLEFEGIIKLCSKCKLLYCEICAKKLSDKCTICFRNFKNNTNTLMYYNEPVEFEVSYPRYYLTGLLVSIILNFLMYITILIFFFLCSYLLLILFETLFFLSIFYMIKKIEIIFS